MRVVADLHALARLESPGASGLAIVPVSTASARPVTASISVRLARRGIGPAPSGSAPTASTCSRARL
jgi:hypothetical protein